MEGPSAGLSIHPRGKEAGYFIAAGVETKMVILHCYPHALSEAMGLPEQDIPAELTHSSIVNSASARFRKLAVAPRIFDATLDMIRSRYEYCGSLRTNFLQAKCMELLCGVVNDLKTAELEQRAGASLTARDLNRVLEARYLHHFRAPPSIPRVPHVPWWASIQTKLKASFRVAMGTTLRCLRAEHPHAQGVRDVIEGRQYDLPKSPTSSVTSTLQTSLARSRNTMDFFWSALKPRRYRQEEPSL